MDQKLNYNTRYTPNSTLDWLPSDWEGAYYDNLANRYDELKKYNWIDKKFTYKFNSNGFRCSEFSSEHSSIMFLGCSYTIGIGLPVENIWAELVSSELKLRCANLGVGAGAADTAFRLCHGWIDKIKPRIVVFCQPPMERLELVEDSTSDTINLIWDYNNNHNDYKGFLKAWSGIDDNNAILNRLKNSMAIKHMCDIRKIKYIEIPSEKIWIPNADLARDLIHPGIDANLRFSKVVASYI